LFFFFDDFCFVLVNLPPEQVVDLMKQMQSIITDYPAEARNILIQNPQLTYAMLQSLVIMGLISPSEASKMLHKRPDISSINILNNSSSVPTNFPTTLPVSNPNFQGASSALPIVPPPPPLPPFHPHLASINFPIATASSILQPNPNLTGGSPLSRTDQEKAQLLMQVLQLSDAQIAQLPADQRASIILLREQMQQSGMVPL
jgi:cleavage stimulation factor subunit 2